MTPGTDNHDDLDFSDLDLDTPATGFDDAIPDEDGLAPARPKSNLLLYSFIGLAVLAAAGGVAAWQLGMLGGGAAPQRAPFTAEQTQQQPVAGDAAPMYGAVPTDPNNPNAAAMPQPGTSDPFNVMGTPDQMPVDPNMAQQPGPDGMMPPQALAPIDGDAAVTSVMPAGDVNAPTVEGSTVPMPEPVTTDTAALPTPPASGEAVTPAEALTPEAFTQAPVAEPQPAPVVEAALPEPAPAAAVAPAASDSAALNAIMDRLDAIEKRLDDQAAKPSASMANEIAELKASVSALKADDGISRADSASSSEDKPVVKKAAPKKKAAVKKKSTAKKSTAKWDKPYDGGAVLGSDTPVASGYTLRAAQSGVAWVADGSGRLQEVRVGDTLQGVGTVRSITQSGNAWSIDGTQGRIAQ